MAEIPPLPYRLQSLLSLSPPPRKKVLRGNNTKYATAHIVVPMSRSKRFRATMVIVRYNIV